MAPFDGGIQVPGPKATTSRYGLLSIVDPITPENQHWESGIFWEDNLCSEVHSTKGFCPILDETGPTKILDRDFFNCEASPFLVYASYDCPPVGKTAREAFTMAEKRLSNREERQVESVFWTGLTEDGQEINPSLQAGNTECGNAPVNLTPSAGPVGVIASMAILESALGDCAPGTGVIHANYGLASFLTANMLIYQHDDAWYSVTGQRLAIGAGYPGTGPANTDPAPGTTWVFATGPVVVYRSETFLTPERFREAFDAKLNSVQVYAERVYAVGWSCCLFSIQMALCP